MQESAEDVALMKEARSEARDIVRELHNTYEVDKKMAELD